MAAATLCAILAEATLCGQDMETAMLSAVVMGGETLGGGTLEMATLYASLAAGAGLTTLVGVVDFPLLKWQKHTEANRGNPRSSILAPMRLLSGIDHRGILNPGDDRRDSGSLPLHLRRGRGLLNRDAVRINREPRSPTRADPPSHSTPRCAVLRSVPLACRACYRYATKRGTSRNGVLRRRGPCRVPCAA